MSRFSIYLTTSLIIILIIVNSFIFWSFGHIYGQMSENRQATSNLTKLSMYEKKLMSIENIKMLYVLKNEEKDGKTYSLLLNNIDTFTKELYKEKILSSEQYNRIQMSLHEYRLIGEQLFSAIKEKEGKEKIIEIMLEGERKHDEIQQYMTVSFLSAEENTKNKDTHVQQLLEKQKNILHFLSSIISLLFAAPLLLLRQKFQNAPQWIAQWLQPNPPSNATTPNKEKEHTSYFHVRLFNESYAQLLHVKGMMKEQQYTKQYTEEGYERLLQEVEKLDIKMKTVIPYYENTKEK